MNLKLNDLYGVNSSVLSLDNTSLNNNTLPDNVPDVPFEDDPTKGKAQYAKGTYKELLLDNGLKFTIIDHGIYDKFTTDKEFKADVNYYAKLLQSNNEMLDNLYKVSNNEEAKTLKESTNRFYFLNDDVKGKIAYETNLTSKINKLYNDFADNVQAGLYKTDEIQVNASLPFDDLSSDFPTDKLNPDYQNKVKLVNESLDKIYPQIDKVRSGEIVVQESVKKQGDEEILRYLGVLNVNPVNNLIYQNFSNPVYNLKGFIDNTLRTGSNVLFGTDYKPMEMPKYSSGNEILDFVTELPAFLYQAKLITKGAQLGFKVLGLLKDYPKIMHGFSTAIGMMGTSAPKNFGRYLSGDMTGSELMTTLTSEGLSGFALGINPLKDFVGRTVYNMFVPTVTGMVPQVVATGELPSGKQIAESIVQQVALDLVLGGPQAIKQNKIKQSYELTRDILSNASRDPITFNKIFKYIESKDNPGQVAVEEKQRSQKLDRFVEDINQITKEFGDQKLTNENLTAINDYAKKNGLKVKMVDNLKSADGEDVRGLIKTDYNELGDITHEILLNTEKATNNTFWHEATHRVIDFNQFTRFYNNLLKGLGTEEIVAEGIGNGLLKRGLVNKSLLGSVKNSIQDGLAKIRYNLGSDDFLTSWRIMEQAVEGNKKLKGMTGDEFAENVKRFGFDKALNGQLDKYFKENNLYDPDSRNQGFNVLDKDYDFTKFRTDKSPISNKEERELKYAKELKAKGFNNDYIFSETNWFADDIMPDNKQGILNFSDQQAEVTWKTPYNPIVSKFVAMEYFGGGGNLEWWKYAKSDQRTPSDKFMLKNKYLNDIFEGAFKGSNKNRYEEFDRDRYIPITENEARTLLGIPKGGNLQSNINNTTETKNSVVKAINTEMDSVIPGRKEQIYLLDKDVISSAYFDKDVVTYRDVKDAFQYGVKYVNKDQNVFLDKEQFKLYKDIVNIGNLRQFETGIRNYTGNFETDFDTEVNKYLDKNLNLDIQPDKTASDYKFLTKEYKQPFDAESLNLERAQSFNRSFIDKDRINFGKSKLEIQEQYPNVKFYADNTYHLDKDILEQVNRLNPVVEPLLSKIPGISKNSEGVYEYKGSDINTSLREWIYNDNGKNFDNLFNVYKTEFGNVIDSDNTRRMFNKFGFDFNNIDSDKHSFADKFKMMFFAKYLGDKNITTVKFVGGVPATGKTFSLMNDTNPSDLYVSNPMMHIHNVTKELQMIYDSDVKRKVKMYFNVNSEHNIADNLIRRMNLEQRVVPFNAWISAFVSVQETFSAIARQRGNQLRFMFTNENKPELYIQISNQWKDNPLSGKFETYSENFFENNNNLYDFTSEVKLTNFLNYVQRISENNLIHPKIRNEFLTQISEFAGQNNIRLSDVRYQGEPKGKELRVDGRNSAKDGFIEGVHKPVGPESGVPGDKSAYKRDVSEPTSGEYDTDRQVYRERETERLKVRNAYNSSLDNFNQNVINFGIKKAVSLVNTSENNLINSINKRVFGENTPFTAHPLKQRLLTIESSDDFFSKRYQTERNQTDIKSDNKVKFTIPSDIDFRIPGKDKLDTNDFNIFNDPYQQFTHKQVFDAGDSKFEITFHNFLFKGRYGGPDNINVNVDLKIITPDNKAIDLGEYSFIYHPKVNVLSAKMINTDLEYRRKGYATAVYDFLQNKGFEVLPSSVLMDDGFNFWIKRGMQKYAAGDTKYLEKILHDVYLTQNDELLKSRKEEFSNKVPFDVLQTLNNYDIIGDYDLKPKDVVKILEKKASERVYDENEAEMWEFFDDKYSKPGDELFTERYQKDKYSLSRESVSREDLEKLYDKDNLTDFRKRRFEFTEETVNANPLTTTDEGYYGNEFDKRFGFTPYKRVSFIADSKKYLLELSKMNYESNGKTTHDFTVYDKTGNVVGNSEFIQEKNSKIIHSSSLSVDLINRRKGISSAIYDYAESLGYVVLPSTETTVRGFKFWFNRALQKYNSGNAGYLVKLLSDFKYYADYLNSKNLKASKNITFFNLNHLKAKYDFLEVVKKQSDIDLDNIVKSFDYSFGDYESAYKIVRQEQSKNVELNDKLNKGFKERYQKDLKDKDNKPESIKFEFGIPENSGSFEVLAGDKKFNVWIDKDNTSKSFVIKVYDVTGDTKITAGLYSFKNVEGMTGQNITDLLFQQNPRYRNYNVDDAVLDMIKKSGYEIHVNPDNIDYFQQYNELNKQLDDLEELKRMNRNNEDDDFQKSLNLESIKKSDNAFKDTDLFNYGHVDDYGDLLDKGIITTDDIKQFQDDNIDVGKNADKFDIVKNDAGKYLDPNDPDYIDTEKLTHPDYYDHKINRNAFGEFWNDNFAGKGVFGGISDLSHKLYQYLLDSNHSLKWTQDKLKKLKAYEDGEYKAGEDPYLQISLYPSIVLHADAWINDKAFVFDRQGNEKILGESLNNILESKEMKELSRDKEVLRAKVELIFDNDFDIELFTSDPKKLLEYYLTNRSALERLDLGQDQNISPNITRPVLQSIDLHIPEIKKLAERVWKFSENVLKLQSDLLGVDVVDDLLKKYKAYAPLERVFKDNDVMGIFLPNNKLMQAVIKDNELREITNKKQIETRLPSKHFSGRKTSTKQAIGSNYYQNASPLATLVKNVYLSLDTYYKNKIALDTIKMLEFSESKPQLIYNQAEYRKEFHRLNTILKENKNPVKLQEAKDLKSRLKNKQNSLRAEINNEKQNKDIVSYTFDGNVYAYRVDPEIGKSLGLLRVFKPLNLMAKVLHGSNQIVKDLTALSPTFMARNIVMDQWSAWVNEGAIPFVNALRGWGHILLDSNDFQQYKRLGGPMSTLVSVSTDKMKQYNEIFKSKGYKEELKKWSNPIYILKFIGEVTEQGNKVGNFVSNKSVTSDLERLLKARGITTDFSRQGSSQSMQRYLNGMLIPFFNARLQGFDRTARTMNEAFNPLALNWTPGKMVRGFSTTAPLVLMSLIMKLYNDDDTEFAKVQQQEKDIYWYVPRKWTGTETFWKIPKGDIGFMFGTLPEMAYDGRMFKSVYNTFAATLSNLSPTGDIMSFPVNPLISWGVGQLGGYDFYNRKTFKELEDNPFNTDVYHYLYKQISKKTGVSVERVRHTISTFTVGLGLDALSLFDLATNDKYRVVTQDDGRKIIIKRFKGYELSQTEDQKEFSSVYNKSREVYGTVYQFLNRNDLDAAYNFLQTDDNYKYFTAYPFLKDVVKNIDDSKDKDYEIKHNPALNPKDRLKELIAENKVKDSLSGKGLNEFKNVQVGTSKIELFEDLSAKVYGVPIHLSETDKKAGVLNFGNVFNYIDNYEYNYLNNRTMQKADIDSKLEDINKYREFVKKAMNNKMFTE